MQPTILLWASYVVSRGELFWSKGYGIIFLMICFMGARRTSISQLSRRTCRPPTPLGNGTKI